MPDYGRRPRNLYPFARPHHGLHSAGRPRRARGHRSVCGGRGAFLLRFTRRQADCSRPRPRGSPGPHAAGPGNVRDRGDQDHPATPPPHPERCPIRRRRLRYALFRAPCRDCFLTHAPCLSTHNLAQLAAADREPVDYLAFGPIFPTRTKRTADPPVGIEGLARARAQTQRPLVAIGGITLETAPVLWQAGANAVAVAADILRAPDPAARAHAYLERARQWHRQHGLPRGPLR